ncbi:MarR family winged helix-turn-helix transcriptional regulator [Bradyrhizobium sp. BR 1433]|uniref:MarR family winged helix-turn-helix transcriptional regulator n=1 Tax=Bradyrhizobium sp. BR 1433 TaxID=3447967 RepID=UPI003EE58C94
MGTNLADGQEMVCRFTWEIRSINARLEELRQFRANMLGVTGPQWTILTALADLEGEDGIPVNVVSKLMRVDASFVTTQSKLLEKKGLLRRRPSKRDARVVQLSLTDKTCKHLMSASTKLEALDEFVLADFGIPDSLELVSKLAAVRHRLESACLKAAL